MRFQDPLSHPLYNAEYRSPAVSTALIRAFHPYDPQKAFITRVILISLKKIFQSPVLKSSNLINIYSPEIAHLKSFIWLTSLLQWWNQTERWKQESAIYKLTCWLVNSNQPLQKKFLNLGYFFPWILQNQSFNWGCVLTKQSHGKSCVNIKASGEQQQQKKKKTFNSWEGETEKESVTDMKTIGSVFLWSW